MRIVHAWPPLNIISISTQLTGSLKGAEERDFIFSKLFCCICIIRSGKASTNKDQQLNILDRLLELHARKGWMKEVVADTLLLFCASLTDASVINASLVKIKPLLEVAIADMAAWQLILSIGLQQLLQRTKNTTGAAAFQAEWKTVMSGLSTGTTATAINMNHIESLKDTLIAAAFGFPKIHRVWEYIISFVFLMDENRELIATR